MKDCPERRVLENFFEGNLGDIEFDSVGEHVAICQRCQAELLQFTGETPAQTQTVRCREHAGSSYSMPSEIAQRLVSHLVAQDRPGVQIEDYPDVFHTDFEMLGDYRIIREIGRGGMGVVFEAEQISLGRTVALKILPPEIFPNQTLAARFQREAAAAAKLHHTNIVPVFDSGGIKGPRYLFRPRPRFL